MDNQGEVTYSPVLHQIEGRIGRIQYLAFAYLVILFASLPLVLFGVIESMVQESTALSIVSVLSNIVLFVAVVYVLAMSVLLSKRRLHDLNKSGWVLLLIFIPIIGSFVQLYMSIAPGTKMENQYGVCPEPAKAWQKWFLLLSLLGVLAMIAISIAMS